MITLTKIEHSDREYFLRLNNVESTLFWMESDEPYDNEDFRQIADSKMVTWYVIKDKRTKVGLLTSYSVNGYLFVGIIIEEEYRRKGYARKAIETFLRATDSYPVDVYLSCFFDQPALGLYTELGFVWTGKSKKVRGKDFIEMRRIWKQ